MWRSNLFENETCLSPTPFIDNETRLSPTPFITLDPFYSFARWQNNPFHGLLILCYRIVKLQVIMRLVCHRPLLFRFFGGFPFHGLLILCYRIVKLQVIMRRVCHDSFVTDPFYFFYLIISPLDDMTGNSRQIHPWLSGHGKLLLRVDRTTLSMGC